MALPCIHGGGECSGCMACQVDEVKYCPECGAEDPEWFYIGSSGTIGCEKCISQVDWQDWEENGYEPCI